MAETLTTDKEPSPAEGFQALDSSDLSDMGPPPAVDGPGGGAAEPSAAEEPPAAAPEDAHAEARPEEPPSGPVAVSGVEGIASPEDPPGGPPADAPAAVSLLQEVPGVMPGRAKRISTRRRRVLQAACCIAAALGIAGGVWLCLRPPLAESTAARNPAAPAQAVPIVDPRPMPAEQDSKANDDHFSWEARLREVDALRQELLAKKEEILQLQQTYQYGVLELEEEAARLIKRTGIDTPAQALKNRQLELALKSIQRRQAYRDGLERPLNWVEHGSEELLYLKRRTILDLQLKEFAEHIDMKSNMADIESAIETYRPTAERLAVANPARLHPSMEMIWKRLAEQAKLAVVSADDERDQEIVAEVCSGNLGRLSELSNLTLRAARCLAESGARELFMNRLNRCSPAAARKLCEWPGQWLCLNGFTQLPPELAKALFAWSGERISLNGLDELPVEAAACLLGWKGRQLELTGLRKTTGAEHLARWEALGGKLYVPGGVRKEIELVKRTGRLPANTDVPGRFQ
jgi:hypothetical protein